jgi:UDP-N-acetyl-2-amino-2-deoxyglucuronate dehydrogenase
MSICTPNYLHDAHTRFALKHNADAICEKPLVLNPWNVDGLKEMEKETGRRIYNILQLRLHPAIKQLKEKIQNGPKDKVYDVELTYITSRGNWYYTSWKGDISKSGGIATNIGIHFYDMLMWIFGSVKSSVVHVHTQDRASGVFELERARVKWFLSIDYNTIPEAVKAAGKRTFRSITVDGEELEFSEGFTDLHTLSYKEILAGNGFGLEEAEKAIHIVHDIRHSELKPLVGEYHPFAKAPVTVKNPS